MHKGYMFLDRSTGWIYIPRDVFDERLFLFASATGTPTATQSTTSFPDPE
jgi:hypothetical protein